MTKTNYLNLPLEKNYLNLFVVNEPVIKYLDGLKEQLEKELSCYKELFDKQKNSLIKEDLEKTINEYEADIKKLSQNIAKNMTVIIVNVLIAINKRLEKVDENTKEYSLLVDLKEKLNEVKKGNIVDIDLFKSIYNDYLLKIKDYEQINSDIIMQLEVRLRELETHYNLKAGLSNIGGDIALDGTLILNAEIEEYNSILKMIELLQDKRVDMIKLDEFVYLSAENLSLFRKYASNTKYFAQYFPKETNIVDEVASYFDIANISIANRKEPDKIVSYEKPSAEEINETASTIGYTSTVNSTPYMEKITIPVDRIKDEFSLKNRLLKAVDSYVQNTKLNEFMIARKNRNFIMKHTGIDMDEIKISKKTLDDVRQTIVEYMQMNEEEYLKVLEDKAIEFQFHLKNHLLPAQELENIDYDLILIGERIDEIKTKMTKNKPVKRSF